TADQVRVWVLKFNLPEDAGAEKPERTQTPIESEQSPDVDAPQQEGSTNASSAECSSPKTLMIRSGLTSWWVLLDDNDRRLTLEVTCRSLIVVKHSRNLTDRAHVHGGVCRSLNWDPERASCSKCKMQSSNGQQTVSLSHQLSET